MGKAKVPQSRDDLERHLQEQLQFLERSADAFDNGFTGEAKRIAVSLRVLCHDTAHSTSLLTQLGLKNTDFVDSSIADEPDNLLAHAGLIGVAVGKGGPCLTARLDGDDPSWFKKASFSDWWNAPITRDLKGRVLSRSDIVLAVSNKDGGAHVDPELDEPYAELSRFNALGFYRGTDDQLEALSEPERVIVRQIAHEVLKTLNPNYENKPKAGGIAIIGSVSAKFVPKGALLPQPRAGRNEACPCGSGKKYKRCHEKPG